MEFNSQICTTHEQSERLLALGLKAETADMTRISANKFAYTIPYVDAISFSSTHRRAKFSDVEPAWSLHRMVQMMPSAVYQGESIRYFMIEQGHNVGYWYFGEDECELCKIWSRKDLYNNIIDSIEWLIKEGYFNKEYLE